MTTPPSITSKTVIRERKSIEPPVQKSCTRASTTSAPVRPPTLSQDDWAYTDSEGKSPVVKEDANPRQSRSVEKPNEILHRLYSIWPTQLTASYRPHAVGNPEATAELNLRYIRELHESGGKVTTSLTKKKGGKAAVQDASLVMSNTNPRRVSAK